MTEHDFDVNEHTMFCGQLLLLALFGGLYSMQF